MSDISNNIYLVDLVFSKEKGRSLYLKPDSKYYKFFRLIHDCYYDIEEIEKDEDNLIEYSNHLQNDLKELREFFVEFEEMFPEQCGYILQDLCDKIKDYGSFSVNEFNRRLSFFRSEFYEYNKKDILEEDRKNEIKQAFDISFEIEKAQCEMREKESLS